jgi:predicted metal-dependent RNase
MFSQEEIIMSNADNNQAQTVLSLAITTESMKQIKTCFYQEKDEIQEVIKKLASKNKRDYLVEYANYVFLSNLEKAYGVQRVKYVASHVSTIDLMVKSGVEKEKVLAILGIEEHELSQMNDNTPRKGVAKKLADIQRMVG